MAGRNITLLRNPFLYGKRLPIDLKEFQNTTQRHRKKSQFMKKIKLTFDARMINSSGIGTQVQNVLFQLINRKDLDLNLIGNEKFLLSFFPEFEGRITHFDSPIYSIKEQLFFPRPDDDSLLHIPHYNAPIRWLNQSIVVIHDLIHLQSAEFSLPHYRIYTSMLLKYIAKNALKIITVSDTTRQEFLMRHPGAADRTEVIYNGIDHDLFTPPSKTAIAKFKKKYNLPQRFFLIVGIGKRHKNVDFVVRSLAPLWQKGDLQIPLVLGGTGGIIPDYVQNEITINKLSDRIITLPRLDRMELPLMYGAADLLIMPSLLEGFGFPVIEGMASGTPVLCSNASSLPEISGNAGLLFNPRSAADFTEKLLEITQNKNLRNNLINKGLKRASYFQWKKHVDDLLKIYRSSSR